MGCLNILYHVVPYTNDPVVLLGEAGSGRSTLLAQLSAKGEDNWRLVVVTGLAGLRMRDFCSQVARAFGIPPSPDSGAEAWVAASLAHFHHLAKAGQRPVLLVDDVDVLPDELRALLQSLAQAIKRQGEVAGLVFTALPNFAASEFVRTLQSMGGHVFELPALEEDAARALVAHQLRRLSLPPTTLDERALASMVSQAQGSLGGVVAQVEALAARLSGSPSPAGSEDHPDQLPEVATPSSNAKPAPFPAAVQETPTSARRGHIGAWVGGGVLAAGLVLALVFQDRINQLVAPPPPPAEESPQVLSEPVAPSLEPQERVSPAPVEVAEFAPVTEMSPVAAGTLEPEGPVVAAAEPSPPPLAQGAMDAAPAPGGEPDLEAVTHGEREEVEGVSAPTPAQMPEPQAAGSQAPAPEVAAAATSPAVAPKSSRPSTVATAPAVAPELTSPAAPATTPRDDGLRDDAWYLEQSSEHFTVQVMALRSDEALRKIGGRVKTREAVAIYGFKRESGPMFALTYGIFPSREAALRASQQLPKELGKVQPWVRKLKAIQQEIREAAGP